MNKLPSFYKAQFGGINFNQEKNSRPQTLFFVFILVIFVIFTILVLRLFQLTIVKGNYYRRLSEQNRIRELLIEPRRGKIIDRKGIVIAENNPADINQNDERIKSNRNYQSSETVAHIIGYRQTADNNDLKNDSCLNKLKLGDKTGKKGIEKLYDCSLRGISGKKLVEIDARGKYLKTITVLPPQDGQTLQLALDFELQKKAYELIKENRAAIVGLKPKTGEVLILLSTPTYNPQTFEDNDIDLINNYFLDEDKPLFNRSLEGVYPPGSTFKLAIAIGALEENKIDEKTIIEDTGQITAGPLTFGNWYFLQYGKTEGPVDIIKAIRRSNDIFFYKTGELLGVDQIKLWAEKIGFGKTTGIGFEEEEGLLPSLFWKESTLHDRWYLGDTYNLSIGQGYVLTTPIQVTQATSVFANDGYLCKPKLLKNSKPECQKLPISPKNIALIKKGMNEACSNGGTGWPLFQFGISLNQPKSVKTSSNQFPLISTDSADFNRFQPIQTACKTGTAESHAISGMPHAWFTVYAPSVNPEIVLTVLIEEGGQGSDVAGPIAKEILKAYFERRE